MYLIRNVALCRDMEVNINERLQMCQRIFKLLRDDTAIENPYRHSLYMNYKAFKLSSTNPDYPVCEEKNVSIHGSLVEKFLSVNCYGQPPITSQIPPYDRHLKEISFFNGMNKTIMVLKCLRSEVDCELLELYHHDEWHKFTNIPEDVFHIPVPLTANIEKLKAAFTGNPEKIQKRWYVNLPMQLVSYQTYPQMLMF